MKASNKPFNLASRSYERRRGFALILALGLMSLVLLLLVSFSALISVESTASQQNLAQHIARQNALIGAYQGLGALQQYAGTDQRVTARADIDLANSANPYWVGVWSTTASGTTTPMRWLVSSNSTNTDPSAAVSNDAIIICNAITSSGRFAPTGTLAQAVTVQRLNINSGDNAGGYAWWVQDEGIKASVALNNTTNLKAYENGGGSGELNGRTKQQAITARSLYPTRAGLETLKNSSSDDDIVDASITDNLNRLTSAKQLAELSSEFSQVTEVSPHDLTELSLGVLAHTLPDVTPTLKVDLSTQLRGSPGNDFWVYNNSSCTWEPTQSINDSALPSQWSGWAAPLSAFLYAWRAEKDGAFGDQYEASVVQAGSETLTLSRLPLVAPIPSNPSAGRPVFSTMPVLSEFSMTFGPIFRVDNLTAGNTLITGSSIGQEILQEGRMNNEVRIYNHGSLGSEHYGVTHNILEQLADKLPDNGAVPGRLRYYVWGFFELWNPYTTQVVIPHTGTNSTPVNSPAMRAQVTGLPTHEVTYWRNKTGQNALSYNNEDVERVTDWTDLPGTSLPLSLQEELGSPFCVNMQLPAAVTMAGGSLHPWSGFSGSLSNGIKAGGWGFKDGLTAFSDYASEDEGQLMNMFAGLPFASTITFSNTKARGLPIGIDEYGYTMNTSNYFATRYNSYLQVKDAGSAPDFQVELYWVPSGNTSQGGGVRVGSYRMPSPDALNWGDEFENSGKAPWYTSADGKQVNPYLSKQVVCRFGYVFIRKDGGWTDDTDLNGSWWLSALSDPRSVAQQDGRSFDLLQNPNELYAASQNALSGLSNTLLERPNAVTRERKANARDQMIDVDSADTSYMVSQAALKNYINNPNSNLDAMLPSAQDRRPLEDLCTRVPLFEVPTSTPVSLGVLQHLTIEQARPFSIGNSWGSDINVSGALSANAVFDVFTLTGVENTELSQNLDPTLPLPNPNLQALWTHQNDAPSVDSDTPVAAHFMTRGAFNINSTSTLAWASMLSGVFLDGTSSDEKWRYLDIDPQSGIADNADYKALELKRAFFRFPHTGEQTFVAPNPSQVQAENKLVNHNQSAGTDSMPYRRGVRMLTQQQINQMAQSIVENIRARGHPFFSMQEFLAAQNGSESVLEQAIRSAAINDSADWDENAESRPPPYSSAYLTQADILNTFAPVFQARSDTFKVRGYGDSLNNDGQVTATALCELTVQRMPELADKSDGGTVATPSADGIGRKFQIISVKWLSSR